MPSEHALYYTVLNRKWLGNLVFGVIRVVVKRRKSLGQELAELEVSDPAVGRAAKEYDDFVGKMVKSASRRVLEGSLDKLPGKDIEVWWLLLDCGCTIWRPYEQPCSYETLFCPKHPSADNPPPKERGRGEGEAWLDYPGWDV